MLKTLRNTILISFGLLLPLLSYSQEKTNLGSLIAELEERYDIKFSYADADIEGLQLTISSSASLSIALQQIKEELQLDVKMLNDRYYAIAKPSRVDLCGKVLDNFAQNRVPGATVEVLGSELALTTNIDGDFALTDIPRDASLRIRYLGYVAKIVPVESLLGAECPKILLAERREQLKEVVVYQFLTSGIVREEDASISLNTAEFGILPGLVEPDVLQTVQALPGINSIDERVSDINVRGGTNDQNLLLWNGIKIYQSGHFFGLISAFNPYLIEKVAIYKNGTPARYGDGVSSVIGMETKNELEGQFSGGAGLNFIAGDGYGQFPIGQKLEFQFSARRSTTDFLTTPTYSSFTERVFQDTDVLDQQGENVGEELETEEDFYFYDFSGKVLYDLTADHKFRLSFIGMDNDLRYTETDLATGATTQSSLGQKNISVGLQWLGRWSDRFSSWANLYFSNYDLEALGISENPSQQLFQRNKVDERAAQLLTDWKVSEALNWQNGFEYVETGITNTSDVTEPPFESNVTSVIRKYAPFSQASFRTFEDKIIGSIGIRANYLVNLAQIDEGFKKIILEPRLNLNLRVATNLRVQLLGEFKSQTTNQVIDLEQNFLGVEKRRWILSDGNDLPVTQSRQGSVGANYKINGLYVTLEGFYKYVNGISTSTQGFQNEGQFTGSELGDYSARGIEFLINKKGKNYSTWFGYTYLKNDYLFETIQEGLFPNNLDVRHALTLASTLDIDKVKLALGINYRSGRPFTKPDANNPLNTDAFPAEINYAAPNSSRLPEYFRADASAVYGFDMGTRVRAKVGISLLNLTNRKNILNKYYRITDDNEIETVENQSLGLTPNISFRVVF